MAFQSVSRLLGPFRLFHLSSRGLSKSCVDAQRAGVGPIPCRRGGKRSALDMAADCKDKDFIAWLRAQGATAGEGPMADRRLADWQSKGWEGDLRFREFGSAGRSLKDRSDTATGYAGSHAPPATNYSSAAAATGYSSDAWQQWSSQNWDRSAASSSAASSSDRWVWQEDERWEASRAHSL
jgi:hypothetical protein